MTNDHHVAAASAYNDKSKLSVSLTIKNIALRPQVKRVWWQSCNTAKLIGNDVRLGEIGWTTTQ